MEEKLLINNKGLKKMPIIPTVFLILVILITIGIYIFNTFILEKKLKSLNTEITDLNNSISSIKKDKKVLVYGLLDKYKGDLSKYERNSNIVKYMEHLEEVSKKYGIKFSGFSISNGEIKSEVVARKINIRNTQTYERVRDFIEKYREDETALLDLGFINSFEGMDEIKFLVNFKVKPEKKVINKTSENTENNLNDKNTENE